MFAIGFLFFVVMAVHFCGVVLTERALRRGRETK
jgi:hypothetical protein